MSQVPCENGSEEGSIKPKRKRSAYEPPMHLDCKSGHPLHPDKEKRTCEVGEEVLKLASQIAIDVLSHTREYVTQPLCEVTYVLVRDHALTCSEEIASKFASIDAFIEWMNRIEPTPKKLNVSVARCGHHDQNVTCALRKIESFVWIRTYGFRIYREWVEF